VHASLDEFGIWVFFPGEQRAEGEVLDYGEFGEDFCVIHFYHTLCNRQSSNLAYQGEGVVTLLIFAHPAFTPDMS
jgi:hypothetical protein